MTIKNCLLLTSCPTWPLLRQTPGGLGVWGNWRFHEALRDDITFDAVVVQEELFETVSVEIPHGNTYFVTGEPPDNRRYRPGFLHQFEHIVTCHESIRHRNVWLQPQGLPWHVGVDRINGYRQKMGFEDFVRLDPARLKSRELSIICSNASTTPGHRKRLAFALELRERLGEDLDFFGRGFVPVDDKWDALAPYRYSIVIENSMVPHYLSEKLTDSILAGCLSFYAGCPNAADYVDSGSFIPISLNEPEQAIQTICDAIEANEYERHIDAIARARQQVLNKLNFFALMSDIMNQTATTAAPMRVSIHPRRHRIQLEARRLADTVFRVRSAISQRHPPPINCRTTERAA